MVQYPEEVKFRTTTEQRRFLETRTPDLSKWLRNLIQKEIKKELRRNAQEERR